MRTPPPPPATELLRSDSEAEQQQRGWACPGEGALLQPPATEGGEGAVTRNPDVCSYEVSDNLGMLETKQHVPPFPQSPSVPHLIL